MKPLYLPTLLSALLLAATLPANAQQGSAVERLPLPPPTEDALATPGMPYTTRGRIERFTHAPTGEIDGFVRDSGLPVHFPVYLTNLVTRFLGNDRQVRVDGLLMKGTQRMGVTVLEAQTITNLANNETLTVTAASENEPGTQSERGSTGATGTTGAGAGAGGAR
ncbi:MAG TPA: hypothetical protein VFB54_16935 [Burkholderiales bacterium]|nr:hypothetical protein [Burkholderiales bacterium]